MARLPARFLALAGIIILLLSGCGSNGTDEDEYAQDEALRVDDRRFGDPYEILTYDHPSAHDVPPGLRNDSLFVMVGYQGGCDDHAFTLQHEIDADTTRMWLSHDAPRDDCDEHLRDDLGFAVPEEAMDSPNIFLLNPQGYEPHVLRWGRTAD